MGFSRQEYWSGLPLPSPLKPYSSPNKDNIKVILPPTMIHVVYNWKYVNSFLREEAKSLCDVYFSWQSVTAFCHVKIQVCQLGRRPSPEADFAGTQISDFQPPDPWEPPDLWYFVIASQTKTRRRKFFNQWCKNNWLSIRKRYIFVFFFSLIPLTGNIRCTNFISYVLVIQSCPEHSNINNVWSCSESTMCVCSVMSDSLRLHRLLPTGSSVHGISQAGILQWVAISSSRGSFPPRDQTHWVIEEAPGIVQKAQ